MKPTSLSLHTLMYIIGLFTLTTTVARAATYEVGPHQPYTCLSTVPWASLAAGDTVNIHWRSQPYREMILISTHGTAAKPITVQGVADPATGQLPVIDGQNAVQSAALPYHDKGYSGQILYQLGPVMVGPPLGNGYNNVPSYITIQNLIVRNANQNYTFTDYTGHTTHYHPFASAIYVEGAQHLTLRNCTLTGSGNGLFLNSKYGGSGVSKDILIEGNSIYGNGNVGNDHMHNVYTEADGIVFQYNNIGDVAAGSFGSALKDRSAGTVIRYNWIGGGGHCIDLVETQGGAGYIDQQPSYNQTFVYGNVLWNGPQGATTLVHYGGDQWNYTYYRRGTLYFYDNTVVTQANQRSDPQQATDRYQTQMFKLPTLGETAKQPVEEVVNCDNNIIYNIPRTPGRHASSLEMLATDGTGTLNLGRNWLSPGTVAYHPIYQGNFIGTITGWQNTLFGDSEGKNDPGFVNPATYDVHLRPESSCISAGGTLLLEEQGLFGVYYQYQAPLSGTLRRGNSGGPDLGAFGYGLPIPVPTYKLSGRVTCKGAGLGDVTVSAGNGTSATTAADGTYSISSLPPGIYTIEAAKAGFIISSVQTVTLDADQSEVDFTAQATYNLSGRVTYQGTGLSGVTVSAGNGTSATTAADGTYTLTGLLPGTYTVSAAKTGYTFSATQSVQVAANKQNVKFIGYSNAKPAQLVSFALSSYTVKSYERPVGTITLNRPVPTAVGHVTVTLTSSNPKLAQVTNFEMWAPLSSKTFEVVTFAVTTPTDVVITASCGGVTKTVILTVMPR